MDNYTEKANKELNSENCCEKLNYDPKQEHTKIITDKIETFQRQQVLLKNICDNLKTAKVRTPHFCITPKVHEKDIPIKPVVSSTDYHASKISKFVDDFL